MEAFQLKQKRAVVTGAASGIGLAIAKTFASHGAEVVLLDLEPAKASEAAAETSKNSESVCSGFGCDVSDKGSVANTFAAIGGPIDVLVN